MRKIPGKEVSIVAGVRSARRTEEGRVVSELMLKTDFCLPRSMSAWSKKTQCCGERSGS